MGLILRADDQIPKKKPPEGFTQTQKLCSISVNVFKARDMVYWRTMISDIEIHLLATSAWSGTNWIGWVFPVGQPRYLKLSFPL